MGLKLFGGALVIFAGAAAGYQLGEQWKKRIEHLKWLRRLVLFLQQEIGYRNATMGEAFLETGKKMPMPYSEVLKTLSERLRCPGEWNLSAAWQQEWKAGLSVTELREDDIEAFCQLGVQLGYPDRAMQESAFRLFLEQLEWEIQGQQKELPGRRKLCRCLGASAGLLITILLL